MFEKQPRVKRGEILDTWVLSRKGILAGTAIFPEAETHSDQLCKYLNEAKVQKAWKDVAIRIRDRFDMIEVAGTDGHMRKTDDYWFKWSELNLKPDESLRDAKNQRYASTGLSNKWVRWLNDFVKERLDKMESLLVVLHSTLEDEWDEAKEYAELAKKPAGPTIKKEIQDRLNVLKKHVNKKVARGGLQILTKSGGAGAPISPVLGPGTPNSHVSPSPGTPNSPGSQSPEPPDPESPIPGPSDTRPLPDRTRPKSTSENGV
ncbi:hypothetical protein K458DRAFT_398419 [Lentithecium fluviatile CBS 122367]|uniref:Uncharacterized protein n=1 Tax=Lentithecium fluviatile CBS 122367 TaxID=1168545 RepID=A0A6G1JPI3_9PLEO|nr:hypothetical protein K458DRAFT_398419 [Lentithecium fluviatile CBS 122367]